MDVCQIFMYIGITYLAILITGIIFVCTHLIISVDDKVTRNRYQDWDYWDQALKELYEKEKSDR